jgi:hypothetical protein
LDVGVCGLSREEEECEKWLTDVFLFLCAVVTTLAGFASISSADGNGTKAGFNFPTGVAVDLSGNIMVADLYNNRIRKVTPLGGTVAVVGRFLEVVVSPVDAPVKSL